MRDPVERGDGVGADVEPAQTRQLAEPGQALEPVACRDDDLQPGQRRQGLKGPQEVVLFEPIGVIDSKSGQGRERCSCLNQLHVQHGLQAVQEQRKRRSCGSGKGFLEQYILVIDHPLSTP